MHLDRRRWPNIPDPWPEGVEYTGPARGQYTLATPQAGLGPERLPAYGPTSR